MNIQKIENYKDVCFKRLARSNKLTIGWRKHFKLSKSQYMGFVRQLRKNPKEVAKRIKERSIRKRFYKNINTMMYAFKIEETIFKQFTLAIYHIMQRLRVPVEKHEEGLSIGYLAILSATWSYAIPQIKFMTFVYRSIMMRIMNWKGNDYRYSKSRMHNNLTYSISDVGSKEVIAEEFFTCVDKEPEEKKVKEMYALFFKCLKQIQVTKLEKLLLVSYFNTQLKHHRNKANYMHIYQRYFKHPVPGKVVSRQAINLRLHRIKTLFLKAFVKNVGDFEQAKKYTRYF